MKVREFAKVCAQSHLPWVYDSIIRQKAKNLEQIYNKINDYYWKKIQHLGIGSDEACVKEQVRSRSALAGKSPKKWGEIHTFFIDDGGGYTKIHMLPALIRAGKCTVVDWINLAGSNPLGNPRWQGADRSLVDGLVAQIEHAHSEHSVDWIFTSTSPGTLSLASLQALSQLCIPLVSYWADDKHSYWKLMGDEPGNCPKTSYFDLSWTTSSACVPWYLADGGRAIFLPEGAERDTFFVHRQGEFEHDVSFVGQKYGQRNSFMRALNARDIYVETFGRGWGRTLSWDEMAHCFAHSRINLGMAGVGHSDRIFCLKGRDFEVPLTGGLYLTRFSEELARCYRINEEIVCYGSTEDCVEVIRWLLANDDLCERIRRQGQVRALREHTWDARFQYLLRFMGLLSDSETPDAR